MASSSFAIPGDHQQHSPISNADKVCLSQAVVTRLKNLVNRIYDAGKHVAIAMKKVREAEGWTPVAVTEDRERSGFQERLRRLKEACEKELQNPSDLNGLPAVALVQHFYSLIGAIVVPHVQPSAEIRGGHTLYQEFEGYKAALMAFKSYFARWITDNLGQQMYQDIVNEASNQVRPSIEQDDSIPKLGRIAGRIGRRYYGGMKWAVGYDRLGGEC